MTPVVWTPSDERRERANLTRLMRRLGCGSYRELHRLSVSEPERFWPELLDDLGIRFSTPWHTVLDTSRGIEWATWFVGARLNLAWNCVHRWAESERAGAEAAVWQAEDGARSSLSFAELSSEVARLAEGLASLGIAEGDAVGIFLPMSPQVAIASHACAHLGAVQVPIFSGFAASAIAARLADAGAKALITADGSLRRGQTVAMKRTADEALLEAPSVRHVVVWRRLGDDVPMQAGRDHVWDDLVRGTSGDLPPVEVDSEAPYLLAYTSGTTGRPKGAVHVQGSFLASIAREIAYQTDVSAGGRIHFSTDMGWIMGPWTVVGGGAVGATVVYAEGAPDWPRDRLWKLIESERVSMLGVSPTLIRSLLQAGDPETDLSSLETIASTGEPWNPGPYRWLHERVGGGRVPIVNFSGGTEVGACFLSVVVTEPIKEVSLGFPALGLDMDVLDGTGRSLRGEVGELVCRAPWPGMTRGVWGDPERYLETYWRRFPGVWTHGDWASVDEDGYWYLHGRSDDTLNIAGKRIGPAELESAALEHGGIAEAAAIGVPDEIKGEVAWIFCVAKRGFRPGDALGNAVGSIVAGELGKAFRPARILFVAALPKTRSAKIVRRAVRARALGRDPGDLSSLENPESLDEIARAVGAGLDLD
ncbi:MAG: AMP-binding protein [Actinobacteria bacterium]|nr:AMP-binding protein [Actinomycetota bacterium]